MRVLLPMAAALCAAAAPAGKPQAAHTQRLRRLQVEADALALEATRIIGRLDALAARHAQDDASARGPEREALGKAATQIQSRMIAVDKEYGDIRRSYELAKVLEFLSATLAEPGTGDAQPGIAASNALDHFGNQFRTLGHRLGEAAVREEEAAKAAAARGRSRRLALLLASGAGAALLLGGGALWRLRRP